VAVLPSMDDRTDFENADKGFVGTASRPEIRDASGRLVWDTRLTIDCTFTDLKEEIRLGLANGVLTRTRAHDGTPADLTALIGLLDEPDRDFDVVTP
jgi:alkyl sulfatase BDS1-like metallo-beta-lactamase superfamily hydrolase